MIKFDPVAVFKEYFQEYIAIADLLLDLERAHTSEKHDSLVYKILQANNKRDAEHEHGTDACKKSSNLNVTWVDKPITNGVKVTVRVFIVLNFVRNCLKQTCISQVEELYVVWLIFWGWH